MPGRSLESHRLKIIKQQENARIQAEANRLLVAEKRASLEAHILNHPFENLSEAPREIQKAYYWLKLHDLTPPPTFHLKPKVRVNLRRQSSFSSRDAEIAEIVRSGAPQASLQLKQPGSRRVRLNAVLRFLRAAGCDSGPFPSSDATHGC